MRKRGVLIGAGVTLVLVALMGAGSVGFPARPQFQGVTITGAPTATSTQARITGTVPAWELHETDAPADGRRWRAYANGGVLNLDAINDAGTVAGIWATISRAGATVDTINLQASQVRTNGVNITASTGTATATVNGCTTAPNVTTRWARSGNMVVFSVDQVSCSSNATTFSLSNAVPAAIQPARPQKCIVQGTDAGANVLATYEFLPSSSALNLWHATAAGGLWTASLGKGTGTGGFACSYLLH